VNDTLTHLRQSGKRPRLHRGDGAALLQDRGRVGEPSFGDNRNVGAKLNDYAHVAAPLGTIPQPLMNQRASSRRQIEWTLCGDKKRSGADEYGS
jgi:hypothetical protein